jgi:hypothetical protein
MDITRLAGALLDTPFGFPLLSLANWMVWQDWLRPCPMRDHHGMFRELLQRYVPEPEDEAARRVLADLEYYEGLAAYGEALRLCTRPIWEREYLERIVSRHLHHEYR